jgi:uncharacterized membrane protein YfcA
VFGLAGTIMMLMVMTFVYDAKTLVIYSILPQILTASIGLIRSEKTVDPVYLLKMLAFASCGSVAGLALFYRFSTETFYYLLASAICTFGLYLVISPHVIKLNHFTQRVLDVIAGVSQALFGISGPIAMTRLIGSFSNKLVIRNYALAFFLCMNLFRGGAYVVNNTISTEILQMMLISAPVLTLVLWNANHLHLKVNERLFRKVVSWIILMGGLSLLLNSPYN